jgi:hypothetical protein
MAACSDGLVEKGSERGSDSERKRRARAKRTRRGTQ